MGAARLLPVSRGPMALLAFGLAALIVAVPVSLAQFTDSSSATGAFTAATLAPPTAISATGGTTVTLAWTASTSAGATGTIVERATALAGPYAQIGTASPSPRRATRTVRRPARTGIGCRRTSGTGGAPRRAPCPPRSPPRRAPVRSLSRGLEAADTGGNGNGYEGTPTNACAADAAVATDANTGSVGHSTTCANAANDRHRFWGYAFGLPGAVASVDGITVEADVGMNNNGGTSVLCVELSWDGGTTWTTAKSVTLSGSAVATYTFGAANDAWGHCVDGGPAVGQELPRPPDRRDEPGQQDLPARLPPRHGPVHALTGGPTAPPVSPAGRGP